MPRIQVTKRGSVAMSSPALDSLRDKLSSQPPPADHLDASTLGQQLPSSTGSGPTDSSDDKDNNEPMSTYSHKGGGGDPGCVLCRGSQNVSKYLTEADQKAVVSAYDAQKAARASGEDSDESMLCKICWGPGDFGLSLECSHLYCARCIRGSLGAILDTGQFPAVCPQCRAEHDHEGLPTKGYITTPVLGFLQQRGVVTKAFYYRFSKAIAEHSVIPEGAGAIENDKGDKDECEKKKQARVELEDAKAWIFCPAQCGRVLATKHASYLLYGLGEMVPVNKQKNTVNGKAMRMGRCACGAMICGRCHALSGSEALTHDCRLAKVRDTKVDEKTAKLMATIGKRCPGCGNFVQKTAGCDIMMCGTFKIHL